MYVVVKLGFCDRVVDINGRNLELALSEKLVQVMNTGSCFLGHTLTIYALQLERLFNLFGKTHHQGIEGTSHVRARSNLLHHQGSSSTIFLQGMLQVIARYTRYTLPRSPPSRRRLEHQ